jgi:hypothetical protein
MRDSFSSTIQSVQKYPSLAIAGALLVSLACRHTDTITYRIILPDQYVGWVRVDFAVETPPALDAHNVSTFRIGKDGTCQTPSLIVYSVPTKYEFFYDTPTGPKPVRDDFVDHGTDAGGLTARSDNPRYGTAWYFFVGPLEYRKQHPTSEFTSQRSPLPTPGPLHL